MEACATSQYSLVLMDCQMRSSTATRLRGWLRAIRAAEGIPRRHTPIVALGGLLTR